MLEQFQLEKYADKFLKDNYDMTLDIPLQLNSRLRTTYGWFKFRRINGKNIPSKIELNKFFVENNDAVTVLDVLRHELVHYALCVKEKPFSDGNRYFEGELKRLGVVSQNTIDNYEIKSKPSSVVVYKCVSCDQQYKRNRALPNDGRNHHCKACGVEKGKLTNIGRVLVLS